MGTIVDTERTKLQIVNAAGELFAEFGFQGVTARKVATKAKVSLGAIPYHFGSMDSLYREVLIAACLVSNEAAPLAQLALDATPEHGLRLAVEWTIKDCAAQKVAWPVKLIERESIDPSPAFREILKRKLKPEWEWLCTIVGRAAGMSADCDSVRFGAIAMHTLTSTLMTHRRILSEFAPNVVTKVEDLEAFVNMFAKLTVDAVMRFSAAFESASTNSQTSVKKGIKKKSKERLKS